MRALVLAAGLLAACASPPPSPAAPATSAFTGTITWESHFRRPHETRSIPVRVLLRRAGADVRVELAEAWRADGPPTTTVYVRNADGCCTRADGAAAFTREAQGGSGARLVGLLAASAEPGSPAVAEAYTHARLGDVVDRASWRAGEHGPELVLVWHRAHDQAELHLQPCEAPATASAADAFAVGEPPAATPAALAPARWRTPWPGVHEVVLASTDTRSLVVEFEDHVVLLETSCDGEAGERLLAAIDAHLPGKPVRYVLCGHYHPHYTGGLRPVWARGATLVATPQLAAFAREIAVLPFTRQPDALARAGRAAAIESFAGEWRHGDAGNELWAVDIGADSQHTDEYVVFVLPRQRLLFQGDLGWFPRGETTAAGGVRARGLVRAIDAKALPVDTLVQGWPTVGRGTLALAELRALLAR